MAAPAGWFIAGTAPAHYDTSTAPSDRGGGIACELRAVREAPPGFGTLMQEFVPEGFRGRRVRLTAWLRSEGVSGWCATSSGARWGAGRSRAEGAQAPPVARRTRGAAYALQRAVGKPAVRLGERRGSLLIALRASPAASWLMRR